MILLKSFTRAHKSITNKNGERKDYYKLEIVKCHLWFSDPIDLLDFLKIHQPIKFSRELFDNDEDYLKENDYDNAIETKWRPFFTKTNKELGFKNDE